MVTVLSNQSSIISQYLQELRDVTIQTDQARFVRNVERIGMLAGYELSKQLAYTATTTQTPLDTAETQTLTDKVVLCTILRAGLPLQHGMQQIFDTAELAFIAAARNEGADEKVSIDLSYAATPNLDEKVLVIADTMLATGESIIAAYASLVPAHGTPAKLFVVSAIASQPGVDHVQQALPTAEIIAAAIDPKLNEQFYIVPGLGDAGDLLYGPKG